MRACVFSDVHGNLDALNAMLKDCAQVGVNAYFFCGDIAGYYYDSEGVVEALKLLKGLFAVRGNHDLMMVQAQGSFATREECVDKYGSSYDEASSVFSEYVMSLPKLLEISLEGCSIVMAHGSLRDPLYGRIYPDTSLFQVGEYTQFDYVFLGHTHYRMSREDGGTRIINPGSLGQPRDGNLPAWLLLDFETGEHSWRDISYDVGALRKRILQKDSGRPYLSEVLLRDGRVNNGQV